MRRRHGARGTRHLRRGSCGILRRATQISRTRSSVHFSGQRVASGGEDVDEWVGGGRSVAVVLGGKDQIVPAEAIRRYLTGEARPVAHWVESSEVGAETEARLMVGWYGSTSQSPARIYPRGKAGGAVQSCVGPCGNF